MTGDSHITFTNFTVALGASTAKTTNLKQRDELIAEHGTRIINPLFPPTNWIDVRNASRDEAGARKALEKLCADYRTTMVKCFICAGNTPEKAEDFTHDFLKQWLSKDFLNFKETPVRFRSFLRQALRNFARDQWARQSAQKRGGGVPDAALDEKAHEIEDPNSRPGTPEYCIDREFALKIHRETLKILADDYARRNKSDRFNQLKPFIFGDDSGMSYAEFAAKLGTTTCNARQEVLRFRRGYFDSFEKQVRHIVASNGPELDDEVQYLMTIIVNAEHYDHQ